MKKATERLKTFSMYGWNGSVSPEDLAESGFYTVEKRKIPDTVKCFSCGIRIANWHQGDNPYHVHQRINPWCDFMMGYDVGNIPLSGSRITDPVRGLQEYIKIVIVPDTCDCGLGWRLTHKDRVWGPLRNAALACNLINSSLPLRLQTIIKMNNGIKESLLSQARRLTVKMINGLFLLISLLDWTPAFASTFTNKRRTYSPIQVISSPTVILNVSWLGLFSSILPTVLSESRPRTESPLSEQQVKLSQSIHHLPHYSKASLIHREFKHIF